MDPNQLDEEISTMREPCPWRILEDSGGAFMMGSVFGALWNGARGYRHAPKGYKMRETFSAIRLRAPALGGSFGIWGALFATLDCSFMAIRGKEDPINPIASGFFTSGILAARFGASTAMKSAVGGGFILACIEGLTIALNQWQTNQVRPQQPEVLSDPLGPVASP